MARAQGARAQLAAGFETAYGTPPAANGFWRMPFVSTSLGSEQPLLASELLGYGRDPLAPVLDAISADGDVVVPIDQRFLGVWLKGLMGNPTTTGAGAARTHEFRSGLYNLPSLAVEVGNPEVPSYRMMRGVKVNSLNWTMNRAGLVTATVACIAQGENVPTVASAAGELEEMALSRFSAFNGGISRGGSLLANVVSGTINYSNNLERVETIRPDGMIDGADEGMATLSGEITVRFADTVLLDQARNGTPTALTFAYTNAAGQRFQLVAHAVYLPRPRIAQTGPGGVQATFNWQAAIDTALGRMATVTLINDVASYANPT